ncbi:MAG TPA: diacylglycerol kinase family protein [Candidatus Fimivivens sp.]|nr:diacylglycerol kinase family protein [Candidatus Fimivivens sp.]
MTKFAKSFRHAIDGIRSAFSTERNLRIEFILGAMSIILSFLLPLTVSERAVVFLAIGVILPLEIVNTCFERLMDVLNPQYHESVRVIKDLTAGAVLIASVAATLVGLVVFVPHLVALFP